MTVTPSTLPITVAIIQTKGASTGYYLRTVVPYLTQFPALFLCFELGCCKVKFVMGRNSEASLGFKATKFWKWVGCSIPSVQSQSFVNYLVVSVLEAPPTVQRVSVYSVHKVAFWMAISSSVYVHIVYQLPMGKQTFEHINMTTTLNFTVLYCICSK